MRLISVKIVLRSGTILITVVVNPWSTYPNVTALKGLNIRLVYSFHYSTPPGLPEGFLVFTVGCTHGYSNKTPSG
jgi:hypothetical protein